jgi:hypothetical protein
MFGSISASRNSCHDLLCAAHDASIHNKVSDGRYVYYFRTSYSYDIELLSPLAAPTLLNGCIFRDHEVPAGCRIVQLIAECSSSAETRPANRSSSPCMVESHECMARPNIILPSQVPLTAHTQNERREELLYLTLTLELKGPPPLPLSVLNKRHEQPWKYA